VFANVGAFGSGARVIFLTTEECQKYCVDFRLESPIDNVDSNKLFGHSQRYPDEAYRYFNLSLILSRHCLSPLTPFEACLLWVENPMIWPSSNNLHLYYRLRQSYGDFRLIHQAPGHSFQGHEQSDLATFMHIGMLFGWEMHAVPQHGDIQISFSHDECVDISIQDKNTSTELIKELTEFSDASTRD